MTSTWAQNSECLNVCTSYSPIPLCVHFLVGINWNAQSLIVKAFLFLYFVVSGMIGFPVSAQYRLQHLIAMSWNVLEKWDSCSTFQYIAPYLILILAAPYPLSPLSTGKMRWEDEIMENWRQQHDAQHSKRHIWMQLEVLLRVWRIN